MTRTVIKTLTIELVYQDDKEDGQQGYGFAFRENAGDIGDASGWVRLLDIRDNRRCLESDVQAKSTLRHIQNSISRLTFGMPIPKWSWKDE